LTGSCGVNQVTLVFSVLIFSSTRPGSSPRSIGSWIDPSSRVRFQGYDFSYLNNKSLIVFFFFKQQWPYPLLIFFGHTTTTYSFIPITYKLHLIMSTHKINRVLLFQKKKKSSFLYSTINPNNTSRIRTGLMPLYISIQWLNIKKDCDIQLIKMING
jgi:hypothetical protein